MKHTKALVKVAVALMADPFGEHYGYPLGKATGLRSGALYPILGRLLTEGWIADQWEDAEAAQAQKRPPRRLYKLTQLGRQQLGAIAAEAPVTSAGFAFPFGSLTLGDG